MHVVYDFSLILSALALLTGVVWGLDRVLFAARRPAGAADPWPVEYARSFFPIILIVLVVRSFLFEPFRIPSDSMMPTLLDGDFIFVSKFSYGLRLPVLNTKIVDIGSPTRGDVIVFRKPSEPSVNYIKRLIGLPGDHIVIRGDAVWVNGHEMVSRDNGLYMEDACYRNFHLGTETLDARDHLVMYCPLETRQSYRGCTSSRNLNECPALATSAPLSGDQTLAPTGAYEVPAGYYFFMGDNRDNSQDSRFQELGFVPAENLVGKAVRIWASFGPGYMPRWSRLGTAVH
ncbi:MAG: signal peptidase I [Proteobacteria bacterium]|nr:signal peptidase I [Pseudomonadota bacterium]